MKIILLTLALMLTIGIGVSEAQTRTDSWEFGFGLNFPRYYSVNITALNSNYGAYLSVQRNFSEHVGIRLRGGFSHIEGQWDNAANNSVTEETRLLTGDMYLIYYLVPCAPVSPYLFAGVGGYYNNIKNRQTPSPDNSKMGSEMSIGLGAEFKVNSRWSFNAEYGYHLTNNSELDGAISPTELNGRDSYMGLSAGVNYFFDEGVSSPQCEPCKGLSTESKDLTDYNRIEEMIVKHIPKEVTKEVVREVYVDKYIMAVGSNLLVLVGVNFAFDKSDLLPESYPVLDKAVKLLNDKSDAR